MLVGWSDRAAGIRFARSPWMVCRSVLQERGILDDHGYETPRAGPVSPAPRETAGLRSTAGARVDFEAMGVRGREERLDRRVPIALPPGLGRLDHPASIRSRSCSTGRQGGPSRARVSVTDAVCSPRRVDDVPPNRILDHIGGSTVAAGSVNSK